MSKVMRRGVNDEFPKFPEKFIVVIQQAVPLYRNHSINQ